MVYKLLACLLLLSASTYAADWALPAANQGAWVPGTNVGVTGGLWQYLPGGAEDRTTIINVKNSPYFAAGNNNQTTGNSVNTTTALTVVSATGFTAGNYISYGMQAITTATVTSGASGTGTAFIDLGTDDETIRISVALTAGDSASVVAGKIRAESVAFGRITTGGSGADVIFTNPNCGDVDGSAVNDNGTGIAVSFASTQAGTRANSRIASVAGNVLTLEDAAVATLTGAVVQHNDAPSIAAALYDYRGYVDHVIYAPAGTYRIASTINTDRFNSSQTVRGDGVSTVFYGSIDNSIMFNLQAAGSDDITQTVTGTKTKGTAALTVSDTTGFTAGMLIQIRVENEEDNTRIQAGSAPTWTNSGYPTARTVTARVMSVGGGAVTVDPPLPWDCTDVTVQLVTNSLPTYKTTRLGFEDFSITWDAAAHPRHLVQFNYAEECWVYNVSTTTWKKNTAAGSVLFLSDTYRCEVRHCDFRTESQALTGDDGSVQLANSTSALVEDNIMTGWDAGIYNSGKCYNGVYSFNYMGTDGMNYPGHNGHNSLELWEGNVTQFIHLDSFHGSGSHMTFYRNWLRRAMLVKRFMYYIAVSGNVIGEPGVQDHGNSYGLPNIGNSSYTGTANPFTGDFHADWKITGTLTTRTNDTAGVVTAVGGDFDADSGAQGNGAFSRLISLRWAGGARYQMAMPSRSGQVLTLSAGNSSGDVLPAEGTAFTLISTFAPGYQELDEGVEDTMIRADNFLALSAGGGSMEYGTADVLPSSLAYTAQPAWWDDDGFAGTWPAVNPDSPTYSDSIIPAGFRFTEEPPPDAAPVLTNATIGTSGTTITFSFTESVSIGAGGNAGWVLTLSTGSATATYSSGAGTNSLVYTLSSTVDSGTTGTLAYTQPTNGIEDGAGNDLVSLSGFTITNNSTQGGGGGPSTLTTGSLSVTTLTVGG